MNNGLILSEENTNVFSIFCPHKWVVGSNTWFLYFHSLWLEVVLVAANFPLESFLLSHQSLFLLPQHIDVVPLSRAEFLAIAADPEDSAKPLQLPHLLLAESP